MATIGLIAIPDAVRTMALYRRGAPKPGINGPDAQPVALAVGAENLPLYAPGKDAAGNTAEDKVNMSLLKISGIPIHLNKGDITQITADAIVNTTNQTLNLQAGVSGTIFAMAGSSVNEECKKFGTLADDGFAITGGGNLKCKKIIHVVGPKTTAAIVTSVQKILQVCENESINTVAIPAIGTGQACIDVQCSVRSILDGIENHLSNVPNSCLTEIYVIAFTQSIYQDFLTEFQKRIACSQLIKLSLSGKSVVLKYGNITKETVDGIVNITNKTWKRQRGVSKAILSSAGNTVVQECSLLLRGGTIAVTGAGNLKCKKIIHVMGSNKDNKIAMSVESVLQKCEQHCLKTVSFPAIGTGQASIKPETSMTFILDAIAIHLSKNPKSCLEEIYIIAFTEDVYQKYLTVFQGRLAFSQDLLKPNFRGSLIIDLPTLWKDMQLNDYMAVTLKNDSQEYKDVTENFFKTSRNNSIEVVKVERIQDIKQWQSYTIRLLYVNKKYPNQLNERHLYHGTSCDVIKKINRHGFNRSFSGKNSTRFGKGTYFAREAFYSSDDKYSIPDENGYKYVYQAAVITGKYCAGHNAYKEPPHINNDPEKDLYDCVVDNVNNPYIFVVFCDDGAYPEYLITFKTLSSLNEGN